MIKPKGGARKGAGRPPIEPALVKIPVGYRLPRWLVGWLRSRDEVTAALIEVALIEKHEVEMVRWLRSQDDATAIIEDAMRKQHRLKPPVTK